MVLVSRLMDPRMSGKPQHRSTRRLNNPIDKILQNPGPKHLHRAKYPQNDNFV
jgi:hypothetical protein